MTAPFPALSPPTRKAGAFMSARVLGIDPGNSGALACYRTPGAFLDVADMPCVADGTKGRQTVNPALLAAIIRRWSPSSAFCEFVGARPTDAKVAAFAFGRCRGAIEGTLAALGVPSQC